MKENRTLAIDPGTREIGIAVLEERELLYYAVKTIGTRRTPEAICGEAAKIISILIAELEPSVLAIEQPLIVQQSAETLAKVIREIKQTAQKAGLITYEFAPKIIRQFICGQAKPNKREVARRIAAIYPELAQYVGRRSKWEELYYDKMFAAVAVGITCDYNRTAGSPAPSFRSA